MINKNNFLSLVAIALVLILGIWMLVTPQASIVYVDVNKLFSEYKGTKEAQKEFETKKNTTQANLDSLMGDWEKELKKYEKERSSMSKKEIDLQQELLTNKQQQINNYQQALQTQIQEEDNKMTQTVFNDLNAFIKEYGQENNYKIIMGANGSGNILHADPSVDITEDVIKELNERYDKR